MVGPDPPLASGHDYGAALPLGLLPHVPPAKSAGEDRVAGEPAGTLDKVPISSRLLDDGEEVVVDLRPHWVFLLGPAVLTAVALAVAVAVVVRFPKAPVVVAGVLAVMVAIPAIWLVGRIVRWLGISLVVTTNRLIYRAASSAGTSPSSACSGSPRCTARRRSPNG